MLRWLNGKSLSTKALGVAYPSNLDIAGNVESGPVKNGINLWGLKFPTPGISCIYQFLVYLDLMVL